MTGGASQAPSDSAAQAKASGKKKKGGPVVSELVYRTVAASQDRKGLSYYAIKQALSFQGYDVDQHGFLIKRAINMLRSAAHRQSTVCRIQLSVYKK
ncbi:histone H1-like [Pelmatolapia mariae]|uniref:histone H1-like n=1 Tax=Pelmatolapia mariae TaxID=158779 RepID=UPI002FE5297C